MEQPGKYLPESKIFKREISAAMEHARGLYSDKLEHHNFDHALDVYEKSMQLADEYENTYDVAVNRRALALAALFHDAWVHVPLDSSRFPHEEARAAAAARKYIAGECGDEILASTVGEIIESTHKDAPLKAKEDVILRMADLHNLTDDYEQFIKTSAKLHQEYARGNASAVEFKEWFTSIAYPVLQDYLKPDNLPSEFRAAAYINIIRLLNELKTTEASSGSAPVPYRG